MDNPEMWGKFSKYLNETNEGMPTSEMGLIKNAPQKAIDAYEEYKRLEKERLNSDEDWE
jgi:hypothetical protein